MTDVRRTAINQFLDEVEESQERHERDIKRLERMIDMRPSDGDVKDYVHKVSFIWAVIAFVLAVLITLSSLRFLGVYS